jgi:hypothetical protein
MASRPHGLIRAFGMTGLQISSSMSRIEKKFGIDLGHDKASSKTRKSADYEQFELELRKEAARMSEFYEVFYCPENSIENWSLTYWSRLADRIGGMVRALMKNAFGSPQPAAERKRSIAALRLDRTS